MKAMEVAKKVSQMTQSIQQEVAAYQKGLENQTAELQSQTLSQRPSPK